MNKISKLTNENAVTKRNLVACKAFVFRIISSDDKILKHYKSTLNPFPKPNEIKFKLLFSKPLVFNITFQNIQNISF